MNYKSQFQFVKIYLATGFEDIETNNLKMYLAFTKKKYLCINDSLYIRQYISL